MAWEWLTSEYERAQRESYEAIRDRYPALVGDQGFACYTGWHGLVSDYFAEVERLLAEHPGASYELRQVKEKFGGLRLYACASDDIMPAVLEGYDRAQNLSYMTCEVCGRPGTLRKRASWFLTRCDEHADGGVPVLDTTENRS